MRACRKNSQLIVLDIIRIKTKQRYIMYKVDKSDNRGSNADFLRTYIIQSSTN
jgi:hypothetical protein